MNLGTQLKSNCVPVIPTPLLSFPFPPQRRRIRPPADRKQGEELEQCITSFFPNDHPVEIDIGCGKGKFLLGRAETSPEINFLGIDRVGKWMSIGARRAEKRGLQNLKFLKVESREFLAGLALQCVSVFHVYFPDPWPKRRHHRRRLVTADFLNLLHSRLCPQGRVELATDDRDYWAAMKQAVSETAVLWRSAAESINQRPAHPMFKTHYELKYEAARRTIYYLELERA